MQPECERQCRQLLVELIKTRLTELAGIVTPSAGQSREIDLLAITDTVVAVDALAIRRASLMQVASCICSAIRLGEERALLSRHVAAATVAVASSLARAPSPMDRKPWTACLSPPGASTTKAPCVSIIRRRTPARRYIAPYSHDVTCTEFQPELSCTVLHCQSVLHNLLGTFSHLYRVLLIREWVSAQPNSRYGGTLNSGTNETLSTFGTN